MCVRLLIVVEEKNEKQEKNQQPENAQQTKYQRFGPIAAHLHCRGKIGELIATNKNTYIHTYIVTNKLRELKWKLWPHSRNAKQ